MELLKIDGSTGEGGGQIVRLALFLSLIKGIPIEVFNIRRKRRKPGLKRQHLYIIKALETITQSHCEGARLGSKAIRFFPGPLVGGKARIDFGSAGSIPLFLQTLLPVALFTSEPMEITVVGGTDVPMGPTLEFTRHLYLPFLSPMAHKLEIKVLRRGFHPVGGGQVLLLCHPKLPREGLTWDGFLDRLSSLGPIKPGLKEAPSAGGISVASTSLKDRKVAHRQAQKASRLMASRLDLEPSIEILYQPSPSPGSAITLWYTDQNRTLGADALGARGKPAEKVALEAASKLFKEWPSGAQVDIHLADHLIPWLGLRGGSLKLSRITPHIETGIWLYNLMVPERPVKIKDRYLVGPT